MDQKYPDTLNVPHANKQVCQLVAENTKWIRDYAELGVYKGQTAMAVASLIQPNATLHLFDFSSRCMEATASIRKSVPAARIRQWGNSTKLMDSYNWSLALAMQQGVEFDFVLIDGAHTWHHDGFAFFLVDKMLRPGGIILFDDIDWGIAGSAALNADAFPASGDYYTEEQMNIRQVQMVIDFLVRPHPAYRELQEGIFQKVEEPNGPTN